MEIILKISIASFKYISNQLTNNNKNTEMEDNEKYINLPISLQLQATQ